MTDISTALKDIIDLHIHAGPSLADRKVDAAEMMEDAIKYGYRAYVVKDHYFPTVMSASLCEKHFGQGKVRVFGGIALNNSVGGINVKAVDAAYGMGAKFVYMPTVSAKHHIAAHKGQHFPGASSKEGVTEREMLYINQIGELNDEVIEVLRYIAERPDLILATGHGTQREIEALLTKGAELGIAKMYANHPFYMINADIDTICRWASLGAVIEINACVFLFGTHPTPMSAAKEIFERVPLEKIVISSDLGQKNNSRPAQGLYDFIMKLKKECGITEEQIYAATRTNPAALLGLD